VREALSSPRSSGNQGLIKIDARPSDAIALACAFPAGLRADA
jgi:bifunctional DNase/RNase